MAKKKKPVADHVRDKKKGPDKKTNPFEVKINRQKHDVLGRKVSKHDKGMPGLSRSKAIKRRKETLLKEYQSQHKSNKFVDKRFGENDASLSLEEKMMKRYALERSKLTTKNKFNLNEEEELTHYGQSLAEIEKFDDPIISDEEEDDDDKRAAAKLVAEQHFGGFMKKKFEPPGSEGANKSWKEKMEELISQSKKAKYERQMEKEKSMQMTEELDEQWKNLHMLVSKGKKKKDDEEGVRKQVDDYDIAVRSLMFEMKGQATDRMKTEEELAKEEKERLEKLEADRVRRMKGITQEVATSSHKSADDLDDGFALEPLDFDYVSYKDGKLLQDMGGTGGETEEGEEEGSEEEEEGSDAEEGDSEEDEEEGEESDEDNYEDLESDEEDEGGEADERVGGEKTGKKMGKKVKTKTDQEDDKARKEMMEKAQKELPFTFKAPVTYDDLLDLLEGHDLESQLTIIDRIRKCHHPSLAEGNKQKLELLFSHLVQFYGDLCIQDPPQLMFTERLLQPLYELTQMSPVESAQVIVGAVTERQQEFSEICEKKGGRGLFPGLDTLLLFRLISLLYPTSDFHHHVTTPTMLFLCQLLAKCPVNHGRDVAAGIFLCNMAIEYVSLSKRYVPEVVNFLHGLLFTASNKTPNKFESVIPPFKPVGKNIDILHVSSKVESMESQWSMSEMLAPVVEENLFTSDTFRVSAVGQCVKLLDELSRLYAGCPSFREIFNPVLDMCDKLPTDHYPPALQTQLRSFLSRCRASCDTKRKSLVMQKRKPRPLKMFEPKVDESFDGRKKGIRGNRDFNEKQKLLHKHKKELKGARRELKKDTQFLARQKLNEQMELDSERKRKVKQIYGGLATQEGEYKKMKLGKKPDS